jgi:hypothetical protein
LRYCVTSRKVTVSIPDDVIGFFHCHISSGRPMVLGYIQPQTPGNHPKEDILYSKHGESLKSRIPEIFPGGKEGRCVKLTTLPPSGAECLEIWEPQCP